MHRFKLHFWACVLHRTQRFALRRPRPGKATLLTDRWVRPWLSRHSMLGWGFYYGIGGLAGNVGKCVCRLHPSNDRHFCLSPTCPKCRPDTLATFCYVGHFFGCRRRVGETCCRHTFLHVHRISRVLVRG
jgi:hypothetical protein